MENEYFSASNMIVELLLEHGVVKTSLASWLQVSVRAVDSILLGNKVTPAVYTKLVIVYQRFKAGLN